MKSNTINYYQLQWVQTYTGPLANKIEVDWKQESI